MIDFYQQHIQNIKPLKNGWFIGLCPFHEDHNPSFEFEEKSGNWICYANCGKGTVKDFARRLNVEPPPNGRSKDSSGSRHIIATYDYVDEDGKLLFQAVRYEPKDFRQRRPDGKGGYINNLQGVRLVPFNLPEVLKSDTIFITEGEKDCKQLAALGLTASTNPMGAGKWREEYNPYFKDKNIILLPDNDKPGKDHAEQIAASLQGTAASIKIIELPGLPEHGDISDWIQQGHTKEELQTLITTTPEYNPLSFLKTGLELQQMTLEVSWLTDKLIPKNSTTLLPGAGGVGKTYLAMQLGEAISRGEEIFGLTTKKTPVFYIDFENPLIVEIDRSRKLNICDMRFWHPTSNIPPPKIDADNWELIKLLPKDSVLIVDTLRACQSGDENSSKDMAFIMNRFKELRDMSGYTIILLHHTIKSDKGTYKGSTAILDLADHVLSLTKVKKGNPNVEVDDDDTDLSEVFYRFGTKDKTRFEPYHIFLQFDPEKGFSRAGDPANDDCLIIQNAIQALNEKSGEEPNQSQIVLEMKGEEISNTKILRLLKKGEGKFWKSKKTGAKGNAKVYSVIRFDSAFWFSPLYKGGETKKPKPEAFFEHEKPKPENTPEPRTDKGFTGFLGAVKKTEKPNSQTVLDLEDIIS
jgi:hypothetical protein